MSTPTSLPPAGWYPDPQGGGGQRWWNGVAWTDDTHAAADQPAQPAAPAQSEQAPQPAQSEQAPQPGYPGAQPGPAGAQPGYPGAQQAYPASQPGYGASQPGYPGTYVGYAQPVPVAPPIGAWRSPVDDRPVVPNLLVAARTVFHKYASFEGRAGRAEYWWWMLLNALIVAACYIVSIALILGSAASVQTSSAGPALMSLIGGVLMLALVVWELAIFLPSLAVLVRRLRDAGFHWGFIFLSLVPFGSVAVLVMACMPSKHP